MKQFLSLFFSCITSIAFFSIIGASIAIPTDLLQSHQPSIDDPAAVEQRLATSTRYLSSSAMEGRGLGTHGINLAADYIAAQLRNEGLNTSLWDGGPFQKLTVGIDAEVTSDNRAVLVGQADANVKPDEINLEMKKYYTHMDMSGQGNNEIPIDIEGFGI